jgi:hypothetical protein
MVASSPEAIYLLLVVTAAEGNDGEDVAFGALWARPG